MRYSDEVKAEAIRRCLSGEEYITDIMRDLGIPKTTIYRWLEAEEKKKNPIPEEMNSEPNKNTVRILRNRVERLEKMVEILKSVDCTVHAPLQEKLYEMERIYSQYSVHLLCDAMEVPRGTFYNHVLRNKREDAWFFKRREYFRTKVQEIYDESEQRFGAEKITAVLKNQGETISIKMVGELMREMGLASIRNGSKFQYYKERRPKPKNHLEQNFCADAPNKIWCSDVTYYKFKNTSFYICAIVDLFSRKVVAYKVSKRNSTHLIKLTLKQAIDFRKPENGLIFHSDQGSNYRANYIHEYLSSQGIEQSFSKPGTPYDNAVMESFFSTLKREELYRVRYHSEREFRESLDAYIHFFNEKRPHKTLKYKIPDDFEKRYYSKLTSI